MAEKLQRIMIDGGFTCPNRDGRVGRGGCTFCRGESFAPAYCRNCYSIAQQIAKGKDFFRGKYPKMRYMAYFQSYSGTYAPVSILRQRYDEALSQSDIVGLIISTRPDCLEEEKLNLLEEFALRTRIEVEIGVESTHDITLERINRGHSWAQAQDAIIRTARRNIPVCAHMIIGLPGESEQDIIESARRLSALPISSVKLHQLQILKGTPMAHEYELHPNDFLPLDTAQIYVDIVRRFIAELQSDIKIERIVSTSPADLLIAPRWGLKPYQIQEMLSRS